MAKAVDTSRSIDRGHGVPVWTADRWSVRSRAAQSTAVGAEVAELGAAAFKKAVAPTVNLATEGDGALVEPQATTRHASEATTRQRVRFMPSTTYTCAATRVP